MDTNTETDSEEQRDPGIRILDHSTLAEDKWIRVISKAFVDREGHAKSWSYIERKGHTQAVVVMARTRESRRLILIRQYRIPFESWIYEFPAGLVDPGEKPEDAALRELEEESGYGGKLLSMSPSLATSAGLTTETIYLAAVDANERPSASRHEAAEAIEVFLQGTGRDEVRTFLSSLEKESAIVDSKLYAYLLGIAEGT